MGAAAGVTTGTDPQSGDIRSCKMTTAFSSRRFSYNFRQSLTKGMMIAIPESEWDVFYTMSATDMASTLLDLARRVHLEAIRKSPRGPKKPRPKATAFPGHGSWNCSPATCGHAWWKP